jgi:predicted ATPase/DNA-binding XRE family transcriptional regulator
MKGRMQNPRSFGAVLQRLRRTAGLSQQELAERAGLSLRGIADLERGARRRPYPATVRRLSQALDLNEADRAILLSSVAINEPVTQPTDDEKARPLPRPLSGFIGREREKATVQHLLETARLVTLTGTGGIGKTRLALEVAAQSDSVVFVDLAPVSDGELISAAVAAAVGIRKPPSEPLETLLARWLSSRGLLLVMDNCEHLLPPCGQLIQSLLGACPALRVLATSRERLGVPGEVSWRVPSLPIPDANASVDRVLECDAVRLFLERATAVSSDLSPTATSTLAPQKAASVTTLVRRLDGIPLAIELAAARVNVLSVEQIAKRLDHAARLLVGGSRFAPARQQTLQATFEWSFALLSEAEQRLFARLSVFLGGWTLHAAEEICGDDSVDATLHRAHILDVLSQLIDKSLVLSEPGLDSELRFRLLEPVRQFAAECLMQQGAAAALKERHARWFIELVAECAAKYHGPNETAALERIEREHANVQVAFDWLLDQPSRRDQAVGLAQGLWWFWAARDHWAEASSRLERLLDRAPDDSGETPELDLLWMAGSIAWMSGDLARANRLIDQCLTAARRYYRAGVLARVLGIAAQLAAARGDYTSARQLAEEGLPLAREMGPRWSEARYLDVLALLAIEQGDFDEAGRWLTSSLDVARAMGDAWSVAAALNKLGDVRRAQGDYALAGRLYEESLLRLQGKGDELRASVLHNLAYVALAQADQGRSAALFAECLNICQRRGDQRGVAECLVGVACVAAATGLCARAARLFGASDAALTSLNTELSPTNRIDRARGLDMARACGEEAFSRAYAAGRTLSLSEAVQEALADGMLRDRHT